MHRFYVPPSDCQKDEFELRAQDARHAFNVLRLSDGDEVEILNGNGDVLDAFITACSKRSVTVKVASRTHQPATQPALGLALPLLKPKAMDWSLQKATELGVSHIWLINTDRSVVRWANKDLTGKRDKLETLLIESMKQCGAVWKPHLSGPMSLSDCLDAMHDEWQCIYGNLNPEYHSVPIWKTAESADQKSLCWWVGPEGDFTNEEYQALASSGAQAVDLGPLVLRAETAVACGLSVLGQWLHFRRQIEA